MLDEKVIKQWYSKNILNVLLINKRNIKNMTFFLPKIYFLKNTN